MKRWIRSFSAAWVAAVLALMVTGSGALLYALPWEQKLSNAISGTEVQVDVVAALPAGTNNLGDVDVLTFPDNEPFDLAQVSGTALDVDVGTVSAGTPRVVEAAPSGRTNTAVDPDQVDAADVAANAARVSILCQNVGTEPAMVRIGATSGGTTGLVIGGGASANDGSGGTFTTRDQGAVYLYDLNGNGNADTQCVEETT
jgi:hypothetical protein|tara:strand:- start:3028 stop:3627 length:600 start_codon:yes stop_codon:yes gene_type:complete